MIQWIPAITAWIAAMLTGGVTIYQLVRNQKKEINKELNQQRLAFYPDVQIFMAGVYGKTWLEGKPTTNPIFSGIYRSHDLCAKTKICKKEGPPSVRGWIRHRG